MKKLRILFILGMLVFLDGAILFPKNYSQRIISLAPSITKSLYLLEADNRLIANTIYCIEPPQAKDKEKIGTVIEVNVEKIFELRPDLVLATPLVNPKTIEKLRNLRIKVVIFPTPSDFNQICEQFLELAKLIGKTKEAEEIVKEVKSKVDSIQRKTKGLSPPKVLVQVGARPLFVATGHYFINDYIEFSGGINVAKDMKEGILSREQVLKTNPDVIIIVTMGIVGEEEKRNWQSFKTMSAVEKNQIYIIDADKISSPTPVSFVETLEDFFDILHKDR